MPQVAVLLVYCSGAALADPIAFDQNQEDSPVWNVDAAPKDPPLEAYGEASRKRSGEDDHEHSKPDDSGPVSGDDSYGRGAADHRGDDGLGTEFQRTDFTDTDFGRRSYRDNFQTNLDNVMKLTPLELSADAMKRVSDYDDRILSATGETGTGPDGNRGRTDDDIWKELLAPAPTGDWVPGDIDRLNNGGFGTSKDNGRPVPYRLNGHVNIQRGLPWESSQD